MRCEECRELLVAWHKGELSDDQRLAVEAHLDQCVACQAESEGTRRLLATLEKAEEQPVERIARTIISRALEKRASDIHIRPRSERLEVYYRIDGLMEHILTVPTYVTEPLATRLRVMAEVPVTRTDVPQDGRIHVRHEERDYDLRVSFVPAAAGTSVVIRVLDASGVSLGLDDIGMNEEARSQFDDLLQRPSGMVIVAGPTGSGKTTTLYAALRSLLRPELAVFSVEDPVEYRIDGMTQVSVNREAGLDFATAMRHVLRQDPDVILCGYIRDRQTLELAVEAALTGHLVLTTLHTNDSVQAIRRLADLGLDRFLIADMLAGVLSQRLVRKTHLDCGTLHELTDAQRRWLRQSGVEEPPDTLTRGIGCAECRNTGYHGRAGIYELLVIDEDLRQMIGGDADMREVELAAAERRTPMRHDAARKVLAGDVSIQEAMRVTAFVPDYD